MDSKKKFSWSEAKTKRIPDLTSCRFFSPLAFVGFWSTKIFKLFNLCKKLQWKHLNYKYQHCLNSFTVLVNMRTVSPPAPRTSRAALSQAEEGLLGHLETSCLFAPPKRIKAPVLLLLFSFQGQIKTSQIS